MTDRDGPAAEGREYRSDWPPLAATAEDDDVDMVPVETIDSVVVHEDEKVRLVGARFTHPDQSATECIDYLPVHEPKPEPPPHPGFVPWWVGWRVLEYNLLHERWEKAVERWKDDVRCVDAEAEAFKAHAAGKVRTMLREAGA